VALQVLVSLVTIHEHITQRMPKINIKIPCKQCEWKRPLEIKSVNMTIKLKLQSTRKGRIIPCAP